MGAKSAIFVVFRDRRACDASALVADFDIAVRPVLDQPVSDWVVPRQPERIVARRVLERLAAEEPGQVARQSHRVAHQ